MSHKDNSTVDNSNYGIEYEGQSEDDARHKRDIRNGAVNKSVNGESSPQSKDETGDSPPPAAVSPEAAVAAGKAAGTSGTEGNSTESGNSSSPGPNSSMSGKGSDSGGNGFSRMAGKLEKAGQAAKGGAQAVGKGIKSAGNVAKGAARGAAGAINAANSLNAAAEDPTEAVKAAGAAVGSAIAKKVMAIIAPLVFKLLMLIFCVIIVVMPFVLIFGLSESEPSPEEVAAAEAARVRGDQFDIVDWNDNEQTFDWLVAEMSKSREQLAEQTGNGARGFVNESLKEYADRWGAEDEGDYTYRMRYNQSEIEMQMDVASIICSLYSVSQSSGGDNDTYNAGDGEGFLDSVDDEDGISSVDIKGDYKSLLRQAQKLAIKTYKVELVYPTGGTVLIYPANLNIQFGWSSGPYFTTDWTQGIDWAAKEEFLEDGRFVETREVSIVEDDELTDETEEKTFLTKDCIITVNVDLRDEFFEELVDYFNMEIPEGMDPAAEYRAKRDIYTSAGGWESYMEDEIENERGFDPELQPTSFETALDASFHFLYTKGVTLTSGGGAFGSGGEMLSYGDIKMYIEEHANNTNSDLVFPGMLPKPVPSYWTGERHVFLEPRGGYLHQGTDTPAGGESVTAGAPGETVKIVNAFPPGLFSDNGSAARGNLVIIYYGEREGGVKVYMVFQHLDYVLVGTGDNVTSGSELGIVGNTGECYGANGGYHLHTETHYVYNTGGLWTGATAQDSDQHFNR